MLSITDLLEARTLDEELAAYLLGAISSGSSFLVGASPGGAGKTTVMAALLNFIPDLEIVPVETRLVIEEALRDPDRKCYLAHEIGHGRWYAYIWGDELASFLRLARKHMIVSNIHADTPGEVLDTPCFNEANIQAFGLLIFLQVQRQGSVRRRISAVYEYQGGQGLNAFSLVYSWDQERDHFQRGGHSLIVDREKLRRARGAIRDIVDRGVSDIAEVRTYIMEEFLRPG